MESVLILPIVLFLLSGPIVVKGQGPVYLFGENVTLSCVAAMQEAGSFVWTDTTEAIVIYTVSGPDVNQLDFRAINIDKYKNFNIDNNHPNDANVLIKSVEVNDAGMYTCSINNQASPDPFTVNVEAIPISVDISCARSSSTDCPSPSSSESNSFSCNCIAIGAYPDSLQFEWSGGATGVQQSFSSSTKRNDTFDYDTEAEIVPTENPGSVTCTLNGYNQTWEGVRNATYMFNPPMCKLQSTCIKTGNAVSLTCTCTEASPAEGLVYSFYRDGLLLSRGDTNVVEADIEVDQEYIFECRGCNGLNYGSASNDSELVMCQRTMETTTEEPITKGDDDPESAGLTTGAIVGISLGVVAVVVVIVVVAVIMCKKGEDDSKPSDSSVADGNVTATNINITSSEPPAPVYGVVKKDSKKKSDKPDNNGAPTYGTNDKNITKDQAPAPHSSMRDSTNSSKPKQDMEMQYADIDHGNKPPSDEVRKPNKEPTEYATVQPVIV